MEDIIDIIVTETTNIIEITAQPNDEVIDVNIIDNREDVTLNVTPTVVEININSLTGNFGVEWGDITGTLADQADLQNVLNLKADLVDGKVPSSQLPSYVDDVVEVANYAALPVTGEVGKIYITLDTNFIYRWTGSTYVEIKDSSAVWGAITGTLSNQTDLQSALDAKLNVTTASSTYVPYTGATANVNLGNNDVTAGSFTGGTGSFATSGAGNAVAINHSSGSGIALNITKSGSGEGIYVNKSSGSGNAVTIVGTLNATTLVKSGGTSSQFLKADGSVDSSTYVPTSRTLTINGTALDLSADRSWTIPAYTLPTATDSVLGGVKIGSGVTIDSGVISVSTNYQAPLNGTGFVKISGTTISYDNSTYALDSAVVKLAGTQTITGVKTFTGAGNTFTQNTNFQDRIYLKSPSTSTYTSVGGDDNKLLIGVIGATHEFIFTPNTNYSFTFPALSGTVALTSQLSAYLPLAGGTLTGAVTGTRLVLVQNSTDIALSIVQTGSGRGLSVLGSSYFSTDIQLGYATNAILKTTALGVITSAVAGTDYVIPSALSSYLPLSGGTLTGALSGTSATFSGKATANVIHSSNGSDSDSGNFTGFIIGGSNAANARTASIIKNTSGDYDLIIRSQNATSVTTGSIIFQNGSTTHLTLASTGAATFSSSVTAGGNLDITGGNWLRFQGVNTIYSNGGVGFFLQQPDGSTPTTFRNSSGGSQMTITSAGRVGIGTTFVPTSRRLSVAGSADFTNGAGTGANFSIVPAANGQDGVVLNVGYDSGVDYGSLFINTGGNTSMTVTKNGNVGIGTISPNSILEIAATTPAFRIQASNADNFHGIEFRQGAGFDAFIKQHPNSGEFRISNGRGAGWGGFTTFYTDSSERMRITSSGNVGIGTTSPASNRKLDVNGVTRSYAFDIFYNSVTSGFLLTETQWTGVSGANNVSLVAEGGVSGGGNITFFTNGSATERMRITSGGDFLVGKTASNWTVNGLQTEINGRTLGVTNASLGDNNLFLRKNNTIGTVASFYYNDTQVGYIAITSSSTSYNTASDYRLKEDLKTINGLEIVNKIKVYDYKWKANDSRMDGVLAHELAEVLPYAVSGVKDGEQMQGVDYSKIVPVMVQAIKELKAELDTLKNK